MTRQAVWHAALLALAVALGACAPASPAPAAATDWLAEPVAALSATVELSDARWDRARPAYFPLRDGSHGPPSDNVVELRALYDSARIAFRARWNGPAGGLTEPLFALVWHKDTLPAQHGETCYALCHNVWSDGAGGIRAVALSVVPARAEPPLLSRSAYRDGLWTLTYSRPLIADNPLDVQFVDLSLSYPVRVRVWRGEGLAPDWLSETYALRFR